MAQVGPIDFLIECALSETDAVMCLARRFEISADPLIMTILQAGVTALRQGVRYNEVYDQRLKELFPQKWIMRQRAVEDREAALAEIGSKSATRMHKRINSIVLGVFEEWVIDGKLRLGDATKEDLIAAAKGRRQSAKFYEVLSAELPRDTKVRDALSADKVKSIQLECYDFRNSP